MALHKLIWIFLPSPLIFKWNKLVQVGATVNRWLCRQPERVARRFLTLLGQEQHPNVPKASDARAIESVGFVDRTEWVPVIVELPRSAMMAA